MYTNGHTAVPAPQSRSVAPETFLLDQDAQQSLPPEAVLALQQVDNRTLPLAVPSSLTVRSQVLSHLRASRLAAGAGHQALLAAHGRIHLVRAMVR
jgi:hypothetical protein